MGQLAGCLDWGQPNVGIACILGTFGHDTPPLEAPPMDPEKKLSAQTFQYSCTKYFPIVSVNKFFRKDFECILSVGI